MNADNLRKLILSIDLFEKECQENEHTDVDHAWDLLHQIKENLSHEVMTTREKIEDAMCISRLQIVESQARRILSDINKIDVDELEGKITSKEKDFYRNLTELSVTIPLIRNERAK